MTHIAFTPGVALPEHALFKNDPATHDDAAMHRVHARLVVTVAGTVSYCVVLHMVRDLHIARPA